MSQSEPAIEIYSYTTSPYGNKVTAYLNYKGIDYKSIPVNPMTSEELKFSQQTQVPVVKIGDEWRTESSEIGLWIDELFPDRPLMPDDDAQRQKILLIDAWVSASLYMAFFRPLVDWSNSPVRSIRNGWKMGQGLCDDGSAPAYIKWAYPWVVRKLPFIRHMLRHTDFSESFSDMALRLEGEFVERLESGTFLGGMETPTLADFSAYPAIAQKYRMGVNEKRNFLDNPIIAQWCRDVQSNFNGSPFLFSDRVVLRDIP